MKITTLALSVSLFVLMLSKTQAAKDTWLPTREVWSGTAPSGKPYKETRIGLWTKKSLYSKNESPEIWYFAHRDSDSAIKFDDRKAFSDSFIHVFAGRKEIRKTPTTSVGGYNGPDNLKNAQGRIEYILNGLPKGTFTLIWKTASLESNGIEVTIK